MSGIKIQNYFLDSPAALVLPWNYGTFSKSSLAIERNSSLVNLSFAVALLCRYLLSVSFQIVEREMDEGGEERTVCI